MCISLIHVWTDVRNGYYITLSILLHSTTLSRIPLLLSDHDREEAVKFEYPKNESVALSPPQRVYLGFSERVVDDGKGSSPSRRPLRAYFFPSTP